MDPKNRRPKRRNVRRLVSLGAVLALIAGLLALLSLASASSASAAPTAGQAATATCPTHLWQRDILRSHEERKYKKVVTDYKTEYQYQKQTHTKVKHGSAAWGAYDNWAWWSPASYKWSFSDVAVLEGPAQHGSGSYSHNGHTDQWYREYQYVKNGVTRQVDNGSHYEYYLTGGGSSLTDTDANWTRDAPGSPWVQFATRTVQDEPIHQGPVRSVNEPDRAPYMDVPWIKIAGSEEPCPPPDDYCPTIDGNQPPNSVCVPLSKPLASVDATCVTENYGEGEAKLKNKGDIVETFRIVRSGKDREVQVRPGKVKKINLFGLAVGSVVKVKAHGNTLDRDKVEMRPECQPAPPPHTGSKIMKVLKKAFMNRFRAAPA